MVNKPDTLFFFYGRFFPLLAVNWDREDLLEVMKRESAIITRSSLCFQYLSANSGTCRKIVVWALHETIPRLPYLLLTSLPLGRASEAHFTNVLHYLPKEEDFVKPNSKEEAQKLWMAEQAKMRQVLDRQQEQMVEDNRWLRQEERSLVSHRKEPMLVGILRGK